MEKRGEYYIISSNHTILYMTPKPNNKISLFFPYADEEIRLAAYNALGERIIGQGEKTKKFERLLVKKLKIKELL